MTVRPRLAAVEDETPSAGEGWSLVFRPDASAWDGRFANNGRLQELPRPLSKLTWDDAAMISPATGSRLGVSNGDVVELAVGGRVVNAPVWILPGHADGCVSVSLGYGRERAGRVGTGVGFNAYALRTAGAPWSDSGLKVRRVEGRHVFACAQEHHRMDGRNHLRRASLSEFRENPGFAKEAGAQGGPPSLYPGHEPVGEQWGMVINLGACIGCNACMIACQAENNIPVVGKEQTRIGRSMHWIRVDRCFEGEENAPGIHVQPVPCMHCENAPCEPVCPVGATVHSRDGLNQMVYNRCVGTRYCSNNCLYKVRRFNFLKYAGHETPGLKLLYNPDVTVRARGVMEKCTYCVQRISGARIDAKREGRALRDGEITTACQQACPARAITFGDIRQAGSEVVRLRASPLNYGVLEDLNTRPRTTYLAKIRNPNPGLKAER